MKLDKELKGMGFNNTLFGDDGTLGCPGNAEKAWSHLATEEGYTHCCVLQDDIELCGDFDHGITTLVSLKPDDLMTFSNWTSCVQDAKDKGTHWIQGGVYGQGVVMPVDMAADMIEWCDENMISSWTESKFDDYIICAYLEGRKKPCFNPVPCLVQHVLPSDSTLGNNNKTRTNKWWVGMKAEGCSAKDHSWYKGISAPIRGGMGLPRDYRNKYFKKEAFTNA